MTLTSSPDALGLLTKWEEEGKPIMLHIFVNGGKQVFVNSSCSLQNVSADFISLKGPSHTAVIGLEGASRIEVKDFRDIPRVFDFGPNLGDHAVCIDFSQFKIEIFICAMVILSGTGSPSVQ